MALVARTVQRTSFSPLRSSIHRPGQIFLSSRIAKYGKTPSWCTKCTIQSRRNDEFTEKGTNEERLMAIVRVASIPTPEENKDSNFRRIPDVVVKQKNKEYRDRKWNSFRITVGVAVAMHLLCLFAPFTFEWGAFWVAIGLGVFTGLLGITLSFHRNLSHRSFKLPKWLEYFFAYCGLQALQGDPIDWVSIHRYHHQFCDTERDPHSPTQGFWFSHMMWLFDIKLLAEKGLRTVGALHVTFLVNSACHVWGKQAWNTGDLSRNNWWVALLAFGEGWHNNHHAFEYSARHGLKWWQIDTTWYVVRFLEAVGLATDVKLPTAAHKQKMAFDNETVFNTTYLS